MIVFKRDFMTITNWLATFLVLNYLSFPHISAGKNKNTGSSSKHNAAASQPLITLDEDYESEFWSLDQDENGNVGFDVLMIYLVSKFNFTSGVVLDILEKADRKRIEALNKRQFKKMMIKLKGIHTYLEKRSQSKVITDEEYKYVFSILEPDEEGNVSFDDLLNFLTLAYGLTDREVLAILQDFDMERTRSLDACQFVDMMKTLNGINETVAEMCKLEFTKYDMNKDGYIDEFDLQKFCFENDQSITIVDARNIIVQFDTNGDLKLNFIDFTNFFINK